MFRYGSAYVNVATGVFVIGMAYCLEGQKIAGVAKENITGKP